MESWLESTFSCLLALFTCLFILTQLGMKLIYPRSSSHWAKLSKADTSVSSVAADSSRRLVCLFSSPSSTPRTWLMALPWACAPPTWRHKHVGLQSLESAPDLGIWVRLKARRSWFGEHSPSISGNYCWGAFNKMRSTAGSRHLPSAPILPPNVPENR